MASKRANNRGVERNFWERRFDEHKFLANQSTDEILDYLLKSKSTINDLTFEKLKQRLSISFSKRLSNAFFSLFKMQKNKKKSLILFALMATAMFCLNDNPVRALEIKLNSVKPEEMSSLDKYNSISKDTNIKQENQKTISVEEELKNNLSGLKPGKPLVVIPKNSKVHVVKQDEDLVKISNKYGVSIKELISANFRVDILNLRGGEEVIIPKNDRQYIRDHRYHLSSRGFVPSLGISPERSFMWPAKNTNKVTSRFGFRWNRRHEGIDISGPVGSPIVASKSGKVKFSGWKGGYGKCVIIDHGNGVETLYAHASKILVMNGDVVEAGNLIAEIGNTGRSTGPHLHFEVRINGKPKNPDKYL